MAKRRIKCCVMLLGVLLGTSTASVAQMQHLESYPEETKGREQAGSDIRSYNSRELALRQDDRQSEYRRSLNGDWLTRTFTQQTPIDSTLTVPTADLSGWKQVSIPQKSGEAAWATIYRREFTMPFKWIDREVFVRFEAVRSAYTVYANGHEIGSHNDSKTAAYFDITKYVDEGKNTIAVVVYGQPQSAILENQLEGQGPCIEGEVSVMAQPKVRIRDFVADPQFSVDGNGLFSFGAIVKSHLLNPKEVVVYYELIAPDDSTVVSHGKREAKFRLRAEDTVRFFVNLPGIESWSHESPKLYTVALKLQHEGRFTEYTQVKVGFRTIGYDSTGIRINGRHVTLCAVDYAPAVDSSVWRKELSELKKRGVNMLRITNFPQHDRFYQLTDELGIYVCNRANLDTHNSPSSLGKGGNPANDPQWESDYTTRVMNMYYTSQTHPSVLLFSLGRTAGRGYNMYEAYRHLKAVETTRPVVYEAGGAEWNSDMVVGNPEGRNAWDKRFTLHFGDATSVQGNTHPSGNTAITGGGALGELHITNGYTLANLKNFRLAYTLRSGKKTVREGVCPMDIAPGASGTVTVPTDGLKPGNYALTVRIEQKDLPKGIAAGDPIAQYAASLTVPKPSK